MMYQERLPSYDDMGTSSLDFEARTRPRAATMSLCRYTVPSSPIRKPTESPPTSPPSLILPPPGRVASGLYRTSSFLSCFEERLASSAPSTTYVLKEGERLLFDPVSVNHPTDFALIEEEATEYEFNNSRGTALQFTPDLVGMDDLAGPSPVNGDRDTNGDSHVEQFGASPVLLSCLRDIARMPRN